MGRGDILIKIYMETQKDILRLIIDMQLLRMYKIKIKLTFHVF